MITVNCAAFPENLIEAELFGYEKGSFTGASKDGKMGLVEAADEGTLFLDEINSMPMALQTGHLPKSSPNTGIRSVAYLNFLLHCGQR